MMPRSSSADRLELQGQIVRRPTLGLVWQGFKNLVVRYPDWYNHNRYAEWACKDNNFDALDEQLAIVGDQMSMAVWAAKNISNIAVDGTSKSKPGLSRCART